MFEARYREANIGQQGGCGRKVATNGLHVNRAGGYHWLSCHAVCRGKNPNQSPGQLPQFFRAKLTTYPGLLYEINNFVLFVQQLRFISSPETIRVVALLHKRLLGRAPVQHFQLNATGAVEFIYLRGEGEIELAHRQ